MKTISKLLILFLIIGFVQTGNIQAQSWKDLKNKTKKVKLKQKKDKTSTSTTTSTTTTTTTTSSSNKNNSGEPGLPSGEAAKKIYDYIQSRTKDVVGDWPRDKVSKNNFNEYLVKGMETLNMPDFDAMLVKMKKSFPALFLYHGMQNEKPGNMEFGSGGSGKPKDNYAEKANARLTKYYKWKEKVAKTDQNALCMVVQDRIVQAEQAYPAQKIKKAQYALRVAKAVQSVLPPENDMIADLIKNAENTLDQSFSSVKHLITGKMHKLYYGQLVGYNKKPVIGSENPASLTNEIIPGKPFYFVGYFTDKLKNISVKVKYKGKTITGPPALRWSLNDGGDFGNQPLYWNTSMLNSVKEQSYYVFNLFPKLEEIDFKSHLEYIPTLNLVKWLTYQMPGEYPVKFNFGNRAEAGDGVAAGEFILKLTKENIAELKEYYKKLMAKKIAAVTFNNQYGCTNESTAQLGGLEDMKKHGEIIRFTISQTGKIMKPWPNEHVINNYTGAGWGVFKQADGKYEILSLGFSREPSSKNWSFTTVDVSKDFELQGSINVRPEIINQGYEITKENINKCADW